MTENIGVFSIFAQLAVCQSDMPVWPENVSKQIRPSLLFFYNKRLIGLHLDARCIAFSNQLEANGRLNVLQ